MKENRITPIGLKGYEITNRMKELMGVQPVNEGNKTSVVELTKVGPDGKVYGIVRENHEYYIKSTTKTSNLISEDFSYIGGLQNKMSEAYDSYAKALKHLNLKFNSLNEAFGKSEKINVFENDNLTENDEKNDNDCESCGGEGLTPKGDMCQDCDGHGVKTNKDFERYDESLTETEQAIEDMMDDTPEDESDDEAIQVTEKHVLSIARAVNDMDAIIENVIATEKKKVYTLL